MWFCQERKVKLCFVFTHLQTLSIQWWQKALKSTFWYQFGWPWPSFKITVVWEIRNLCAHFYATLSIDLDEIWCVASVCWFVKLKLNLFPTIDIQVRNNTCMISQNIPSTLASVGTPVNQFCFKLGMMMTCLNSTIWFQFDLKDLELQSRSQVYGNARTSAIILL